MKADKGSDDGANRQSEYQGVGEEVESLARAVIGAAIEVHRLLGPGFAESVYEEALCIELQLRSIPFSRQRQVILHYKGKVVGESRLDLLIRNLLVVELKSVDALADVHLAQVISYLKATGCPLGLLINFNVSYLKYGIKRVVLSAPW